MTEREKKVTKNQIALHFLNTFSSFICLFSNSLENVTRHFDAPFTLQPTWGCFRWSRTSAFKLYDLMATVQSILVTKKEGAYLISHQSDGVGIPRGESAQLVNTSSTDTHMNFLFLCSLAEGGM
jgi:hypothetical protein